MTDKVTVIIPVRNGEHLLARAIESALAQNPYPEIIVVDNGSTDRSVQIAQSYEKVKVLREPKQGANIARNTGLEACETELIKFLDADDYLLPATLEAQTQQAAELDETSIPIGKVFQATATTLQPLHYLPKNIPTKSRVDLKTLILSNIPTSAPLHRRSHLRGIGGFDPRLTSRQEWNLNLRLALNGCYFVYFPTNAYVYDAGDRADRISKRRMNQKAEARNLKIAIEPLQATNDPELQAALGAYIWSIGRQFSRKGDFQSAKLFYRTASRTGGQNLNAYLPRKYMYLSKILGPFTPDIILAARRSISQRLKKLR